MLGHKLWQALCGRRETWVTLRSDAARYGDLGLFPDDRTIGGVDAGDFDTVVRACEAVRPNVIVNGIGVVKQLKAAHDPVVSLTVNSLFPHRLSALCRATGARLIHFSTDCVFSGCRGNYTEADQPDANDLYGRTKLLGEVAGSGSLTLRTSIIGRELSTSTGLTEWFLSHRGGRVEGYRQARFSGLTTRALSRLLVQVIDDHPALTGVYHVASAPITKYDVLCLLNERFDAKITIDPVDEVQVDRTLDGTRFRSVTGWTAPDWNQMIADMSADPTPYDEWRRARVS
jgi:dTDP-4-dehydrorhamnose reductase